MRQIILDTETTGLSPTNGDRVIEIGCLEMIDRRLTGKKFHEYLNPGCEISVGASRVHGITNVFLKDKPKFEDIAEEFKLFIEGAELIIHNAPFDVGFLDNELVVTKNKWKTIKKYCTIFDTLALARKNHPGQKNNLDALCKRYNINNAHRTLHGALLDSEILAELYLIMTGGQTAFDLSSETLESEKLSKSLGNVVSSVMLDLPIIKANESELSAHQQSLENIKKRSAQHFVSSLWDEA